MADGENDMKKPPVLCFVRVVKQRNVCEFVHFSQASQEGKLPGGGVEVVAGNAFPKTGAHVESVRV